MHNRHKGLCSGTCPPSGRRLAKRWWGCGQGTSHRSMRSPFLHLTPCRWNLGWLCGCIDIDYQCFENTIKDCFRGSRKRCFDGLKCILISAKRWLYLYNAKEAIILPSVLMKSYSDLGILKMTCIKNKSDATNHNWNIRHNGLLISISIIHCYWFHYFQVFLIREVLIWIKRIIIAFNNICTNYSIASIYSIYIITNTYTIIIRWYILSY